MSGVLKVLTGILGVMAVVACLATIGIIGYSMTGAGDKNDKETSNTTSNAEASATVQPLEAPTTAPDTAATPNASETPRPVSSTSNQQNHVHNYEEKIVEQATCYKSGRIQYSCECGDSYYVDIMSTGHVPGEWEIVRMPTEDREGLWVRKCIYCDDIVAQESIYFEFDEDEDSDSSSGSGSNSNSGSGSSGKVDSTHIHQYAATIEREPSCTLAGLRKYTCDCGAFYTEMIPADGHVATDWTVVEEATATRMGREQRTCAVCGVLLDSRPVDVSTANPSASANASASAGSSATATARPSATAGASASAGSSANPSSAPTAHVHNYQSYVLKAANCTEKGIRSFVCSGCGSSYAESIELDLNNHTFRAVVIPATQNTQGYTAYTCIRCNYSYFDNYTPVIGN